MDGVFIEAPCGRLKFRALPAPSSLHVAELLTAVHARVHKLLRAEGALDEDAIDPLSERSLTLAAHLAGSVQQRMALGPRAGKRPASIGRDPHAPWVEKRLSSHAALDGFDLHAGVAVAAHAHQRREQLLRYITRPALSHDRLALRADGRVLLTLKTPRFDGTTHQIFEPFELLSRLVALIPRPHKNQLVYHGLLAPNAKLRARVTAYGRASPTSQAPGPSQRGTPTRPNNLWAHLMRRAFDLDVLACPRCAGPMKLLALVTDARAASRFLAHLSIRDHAPPIAPAGPHPDLDHVA